MRIHNLQYIGLQVPIFSRGCCNIYIPVCRIRQGKCRFDFERLSPGFILHIFMQFYSLGLLHVVCNDINIISEVMRLILTSGVRYVILLCFFLTACYILALYDANDAQQIRAVSSQVNVGGSENNHRNLPYVSRRDLSHEECKQNFPKQYADSQYSIGRGKIFLEEEDGDYQGLVQGKIEDSKVRSSPLI